MENKRKQYIVDKKFQMKYTFSILGLIFFGVAIIVGIIGANVAYNNNKLGVITNENDKMVKNLDNIMLIQDNIVQTIMTWAQNPKEKPNEKAIMEVAQRHFKNINTIKGNINTVQTNILTINRIISYNTFLLLLIIVIIIVQGVAIYYAMIRKTHKISGPLYVMSTHMKDIINGKIPDVRALRTSDEFTEFYSVFKEMVEAIKKRESK